jgi:hypothetical protein
MFPGSRPHLARGRLICDWELQPGPALATYQMHLEAEPAHAPRVFVLRPDLIPNAAGELPHVYDYGGLCLNLNDEWHPRMLFTDTFVPWAAQWLIFYEIWRVTEVWEGDGPDFRDAKSQKALLHPYSGPTGVKFAGSDKGRYR